MQAAWSQKQAQQAQSHVQQQAQQQALAMRALQQPVFPSHNQVYPPHPPHPPHQGKLNTQHAAATSASSQVNFHPIPVASMLARSDPFAQPTMLNQDNKWSSFDSSNTTQWYPQFPNETAHRSQANNAYQDNDWTCLPSDSPRYPQHSNETTPETAAFPVTLSAVVSAPPSETPSEDFSNLVAQPVSSFLLHQACMLYAQNETVIQCALLADPSGTCRKLPGVGYCYPINIALQNNASLGVLQLLCDADPSVLVEKDGEEECCSLTVALSQKFEMDVVSLILHANPDVVRVSDRHKNYPLHTACFYGSSPAIINLLCSTYPNAIRKKNFHGQTPLHIASRSSICSDDVIDYLQNAAFRELEDVALSYLDSI